MRKTPIFKPVWLVLAMLAGTVSAQDRGLMPPADALGGAVWQARFERDTQALVAARNGVALGMPTATALTLRLLGDYQFSTFRLGSTGGLRLSGGLLINLRNSPVIGGFSDNLAALPYAGIGYSSGSLRGDWGFSADVGLAAPGLSSARMDRLLAPGAALGLDNAARLLPMIRLGMNVAF